MKQPLYIKSSCAITPQHTYESEQFLKPAVSTADGMLMAIDADYTKFISPIAIRRMSRPLKMGITAGMKSLQLAGVTQPDGIITGTCHGSVTDMERFLKDMIMLKEEALNPTYFIQSTYNSINGWLALQTKSTCYNQTFVHRGFSFELCLFDAQLLLAEAESTQNILLGAFDELTPEYFFIRTKRDYWKKQIPADSLTLLQDDKTEGTIAGEGAVFFTVSNDKDGAACAVQSIEMLQDPSAEELQTTAEKMLAENGLQLSDVDVLLTGMNGDSRIQPTFDELISAFPQGTTIAAFKHLCGEYHTASGFALWLADHIFRTQQLPTEIIYKNGNGGTVKNILVCNYTSMKNASLILVKGVE